MGLGDTLGALPPENGGTGSTSAQGILEKAYPVGSIYMSLNNTDPGTLFGGTWAPIRDRFLVGAGGSYAAKATGGEATHKLTVAEMPSHQHLEPGWYDFKQTNLVNPESIFMPYGHVSENTNRFTWTPNDNNLVQHDRPYSQSTGGGTAHNNMPPYYAVHMWARTA